MPPKTMTDSSMPTKQNGLARRKDSTILWFEIRAPKDLAHIYSGRRYAHRVSLNTRDPREANLKASQLWAEWHTKFDEQRKGLDIQQAQHLDSISPEVAAQLGALVLRDTLSDDERLRTDTAEQAGMLRWMELSGLAVPEAPTDRFSGMPESLADKLAELHQAHDDETKLAYAKGKLINALPAVQRAGHKLGIVFDVQTPGIELALRAGLVAMRQATSAKVSRDRGEVIETPAKAPAKEANRVYRLRDVFNQWKASVGAGLKAGSVRAKELALEDFQAFSGNPPITEITRAQGEEFKAFLMAKKLASKTKHQRITDVKTLLKYAYHNLEWLPRQPWHGLDIDYKTETPRNPWTPEQLQGLFSLPLFQRYELPHLSKAGSDAAYWIPLLALFTGARSGELCQLRVADIKEVGGVWLMDINEDDEGKSTKTDASIRVVPIHRELRRLGFLDYLGATREAGHTLLWPKLPILIKDKPSHGFSWWFCNYPRNAVDGMKLRDFHSFRHTVRTLLMDANHPEKVQDRITGHETTGNSGKRIYAHVSMPKLVEAVESLHYPGLTLPRVYKPAKGTEPAQAGVASADA